jgi:hypothetical protein
MGPYFSETSDSHSYVTHIATQIFVDLSDNKVTYYILLSSNTMQQLIPQTGLWVPQIVFLWQPDRQRILVSLLASTEPVRLSFMRDVRR